jgi:hypothetical protein
MAEQLLAQAVTDLDALQPQLPLTQQHELIRHPAEYAEFFKHRVRSQHPTADPDAPSQGAYNRLHAIGGACPIPTHHPNMTPQEKLNHEHEHDGN